VIENNKENTEIKCIFCGKELNRSEMVRFRGAISCRDCAEKQKTDSNLIVRPFVYLAGIGCLIGMLTFIYFTLHITLYSQAFPTSYIQPLGPFLAGMILTQVFVSFGLYAINRIQLYQASIIGTLTGFLAAVSSAIALFDFITAGPYFTVNESVFTKTLDYYPTVMVTYILFVIVTALAILLHMANTKTEYVSIISAALFLLSTLIVMSIWILAGFLNIVAYAVAFGFFVSRKQDYEELPIQPL
jgi:hypothetical protein